MKKDKTEEMQKKGRADETSQSEAPLKEAQEVRPEEEPKTPEADPNLVVIEALQKERDDYIDALKRERADFENFKKRNQALSLKVYTDTVAEVAGKFLPVLDNLERALLASTEAGPLTEGVKLVEKQLIGVFESLGVKRIEAEGKAFDPNFHEAVAQVEGEKGEEPGTVKQVMQKGYSIGDRVLRHSMVSVIR